MKRFILILVSVLMLTNLNAQNYVQVGNGSTEGGLPTYLAWNYSYSSMLYHASDIGSAKAITKIAINAVNDISGLTLTNQKMWMKHTDKSEFTFSGSPSTSPYEDPDNNGFTLVWEGSINYVQGWIEIDITDFAYNGTDNIIIHWENRHGSSTYSAEFFATDITDQLAKNWGGDSDVPTSPGYTPYPNALPNMRFYYEGDGPATPSNFIPANEATKVNLDSVLRFTIGKNTTSYDLLLGTDEDNLVKVVENMAADSGDYFYTPEEILLPYTKYYWQVIAKKGDQTESSTINSFTTQYSIHKYPYEQGFEDDSVIWNGYGNLSLAEWEFDGWYSLDEADPENAHSDTMYAYIGPGDAPGDALTTCRILLPENARISYYWRNGASLITKSKIAGHDTTFFEASIDGKETWVTLDTLMSDENVYHQSFADLSDFAGNNTYVRWRYVTDGDYSLSKRMYLDDILIDFTPTIAIIEFPEDTITFENVAIGGSTKLDFQISNFGTEDLVIDSVTVAEPFYCEFTQTVPAEQVSGTTIEFKPTESGTFSTYMKFHINHDYEGPDSLFITGSSLDLLDNFFESFDTSDEIPEGWKTITPENDPSSDVYIVSSTYDSYSEPNCVKMLAANDTTSDLILVTPGITGFNENMLSFQAFKYTDFEEIDLIIGLMMNPEDASTFESIDTIALNEEYTKYDIIFDSTNTKPYVGFKHGNNAKFSSIRIDDVEWHSQLETAPNPASAVYPVSMATKIDFDPILDWVSGGGNPTGYKLSFGTDNPPTNILDSVDMADKTSYQVINRLDWARTYYWRVVPYNEYGEAEDCPTWMFTTMPDPTILEYPYEESFENVIQATGSSIPLGWRSQTAVSYNYWDLFSNIEMARSGINGQWILFTFPGVDQDAWIYSPPLHLEANKYYEVGLWYTTMVDPVLGEIFDERMEIVMGTQPNDSSMTLGQIFDNDFIINTEYELGSGIFQATETDDYFVGIHAYSLPNKGALMIDDFYVKELEAAGPAEVIAPIDGATDIELLPTLEWNIGTGGTPQGYKLFLGTDNPPTNMINGTDSTDTLTYDITSELDTETTYYWQIVPYNVAGDAADCPVWSFTTGDGNAIQEINANTMLVYPNPNNGEFTVGINNYEGNDLKIEIIDICGKVIYTENLWQVNKQLELRIAEKGVYFIRLSNGNKQTTKRLIVQ